MAVVFSITLLPTVPFTVGTQQLKRHCRNTATMRGFGRGGQALALAGLLLAASALLLRPTAQCRHTIHTVSLPRRNISQTTPAQTVDCIGCDLVVPDVANLTENALPEIAKQVLLLEKQGKGKKIIAMSLYGDNPRYTYGAVLNALIAKRDWQGWTLRFYLGEGVPEAIIETITSLGAETVRVDLAQGSRVSMYWRFFALEDRTATRMISRDADAQLSLRDRSAVNEWVESGRFFHTLHDHDQHGVPVLGGMWGAVNGFLHPRIMQQWRQSKDQSSAVWSNDQGWLASVVWPLAKQHTLDHASFLCNQFGAAEWRGFPTQRLHQYDFVGNAYRPEDSFVGTTVPLPCPVACRRKQEWENC